MIFSSCIFTILMMFDAASATVAAAAADETYNHSRDIIKHWIIGKMHKTIVALFIH